MNNQQIGQLLKANIDLMENVRASWVQEMFALINELVRRADKATVAENSTTSEAHRVELIAANRALQTAMNASELPQEFRTPMVGYFAVAYSNIQKEPKA